MFTYPPLSMQVQLFRWIEKDDGVQELQTECGYHGHILALYMQVACRLRRLDRESQNPVTDSSYILCQGIHAAIRVAEQT